MLQFSTYFRGKVSANSSLSYSSSTGVFGLNLSNSNTWLAQQNFTNIAIPSGDWIYFNTPADTNWTMGMATTAFTTGLVNRADSINITTGAGTAGPDGFAIGSTGATSSLEVEGHNNQVYIPTLLTIGTTTRNGSDALDVTGTYKFNSAGVFAGTTNVTGTFEIGGAAVALPISVANGGTNASSASGTALDNITGFSSTGILNRTGAGAYSFLAYTNSDTPSTLVERDSSGNFSAGAINASGGFQTVDGISIGTGTAITAGGSGAFAFTGTSTSGFGTYFGSGAPTISAAQGSLYLRSDGLPYYNTNGTTGWNALVSAGANSSITSLTGLTTPLSVAQGGTGTATPALVAGTNVTITGTWPDQTINASGGGGSVSITAGTPNIVLTPSPLTGTGTVGTTQPLDMQSVNSAFALPSADVTKVVERTNAGAQTDTIAQATGAFGAGFTLGYSTAVSANAITATTSTIGGLSTVQLGAYQALDLVSDGTNYIPFLGVPIPPTQTGTTYLRDDMSWHAPSGSGTVNSGSSGQVAYYASSGTAVSGESTITSGQCPNGTTGATGCLEVGTGLGVTSGVVSVTYGTATNQAAEGGVITAGGPIGSATVAPVVTYNAAGQLTAVTSATITPAIGSVTGLGTGVATFLATPSGANLASALTTALPTTAGGTGAASLGAAGIAQLGVANTFTAAQSVTPTTISNSTCTGTYTLTPSGTASNDYNLTCAASAAITIANPTTMTPGTTLNFTITQPSSGSPATLSAVGTHYLFPGGTLPVLSTANSALDGISCRVETTTQIWCAPPMLALAFP